MCLWNGNNNNETYNKNTHKQMSNNYIHIKVGTWNRNEFKIIYVGW